MQLKSHLPNDYADAQRALLPPGAAFDWPQGGLGDALLQGMGQEPARVGDGAQQLLDAAIAQHTPKAVSWHIDAYRKVANDALIGVAEVMPRRTFAVGGHVGDRVWSAAAPATTFSMPLVKVDHLVGPLRVGSHVGDGCWTSVGRMVLRVRYYRSVVNPKLLWDALTAFKQAHVWLWFEDITGSGGAYGQD
jgi:hypothetical protein